METKVTYKVAGRYGNDYDYDAACAEEKTEVLSGENAEDILEQARARAKELCETILSLASEAGATVWMRFDTPELGDFGYRACKYIQEWPVEKVVREFSPCVSYIAKKNYETIINSKITKS